MSGILLKHGTVADGETRTTYQSDVLISDGVITCIGENIEEGDNQVIDCTGLIVTAGYIDSHVHIESSMVLPHAFGVCVLPFGTTAVIADPHEVVNVKGAEGLNEFLDEAKKSQVDVFTVVPSSVPATPLDTNGAGKFLASDMKPFVDRDDIVGLGEVMCYFDVAAGNPEIMDKIRLFKDKTIDGHTAGMPEELLDAYVKAGVNDDHECSDAHLMMERYRKGMNIYIREGSAARNARELLRCVKENALDVSRFAFCTDDKHLATIQAEGHISYIVEMARRLGFSWGEVAGMASYNPCRFYRLKNRGNIKENYIADIVVTDDAGQDVRYVIKDGLLVAQDMRLLNRNVEVYRPTIPFENTVKYKVLKASDFALPEQLKNVAIELVDEQIITNRIDLQPGEWKNLSLLATIERYGKNGNISVCLLKGYGIKGGAIATSVSHDSHNVVCAGENPEDMALACNRLREIGGGYVIASWGKVVGELPLTAYGLMSVADADTTARNIERLNRMAASMDVNKNIDAFTTLSFLALPVIPTLRLLDTGLYDTMKGEFIR